MFAVLDVSKEGVSLRSCMFVDESEGRIRNSISVSANTKFNIFTDFYSHREADSRFRNTFVFLLQMWNLNLHRVCVQSNEAQLSNVLVAPSLKQ